MLEPVVGGLLDTIQVLFEVNIMLGIIVLGICVLS